MCTEVVYFNSPSHFIDIYVKISIFLFETKQFVSKKIIVWEGKKHLWNQMSLLYEIVIKR